MTQIFKWLELIQLGYKLRFELGIGHGYDDTYEGYLIVFYHRPRLVWLEPPKPEIINSDDIPF
jgi:hypothetical protein